MRLRTMARAALAHYDLDVRSVRLITNATNGIFRVDTACGEIHVLRISDPKGCHDVDEIRSEMMWLGALRRDTDLGVPLPLETKDGALAATIRVDGVPEPRHCVVFSWLLGSDLADRLSLDTATRFGVLAAGLHEHAASFVPPPGFRVRSLDGVFPYTDPTFSFVEPVVLFDESNAEVVPAERRDVFRRTIDRVQEELDRVRAEGGPPRVTHNDLHQWNVKVCRGRLRVLDFEDLAWGHPVQDVATTLYYVEDVDGHEELWDAFRHGYERVAEWPETRPGQRSRPSRPGVT